MCRYMFILGTCLFLASSTSAQLKDRFHLPPGFVIEQVAGPPLVEHPLMGNFDDAGRFYFADSAGLNLPAAELLKKLPNRVRVLEAADDKGIFTKGGMFAEAMSFPQGALWHRGAVYAASPPSIWKLSDSGGTGKADKCVELVTKFGFTGNAADIHGPFLSPDGRIYWCDGRHGHDIPRPDGTILKGKAARIFRARPDGSEVEVVCGGGMDNPVEIAFTDEGEPFVTVDILHNKPARNDGIIFAIEGGVYPWHDVYKEFPSTGELLPAIENLGWVAPSGLMRYRSGGFGKEYRGNLFSAQFNRNRIQRHVLERDGGGFKIRTEDFLTSSDKNFHPTDVLEDADGSLLVIDTGGWFRIGCPTSKIAQPEIKGAIYRIRKVDAAKVDDPRGLRLAWKDAAADALVARLDDPRWAVRDRALDELALRGKAALPALEETLASTKSTDAMRNAVWALCRMDEPAARGLVRRALGDADLSVQLAAIHAAGLHRDVKALPMLCKLVTATEPALRRQAATALGRIRQPEAVAAIMEALTLKGGDRFVEHTLIHALIQIDHPEAVLAFLKQPDPRQQRAALIALDQMPKGKLEREQVTALLGTDDAALRKTAFEVISRKPGWGVGIAGLLRGWMEEKTLDAARRDGLRELVGGLASDGVVQDLVSAALAKETTATDVRLTLLDAVIQAPIPKLPAGWLKALGAALAHSDARVVEEAIGGVHQRGLTLFDEKLAALATDVKQPARTRVLAFAALDGRSRAIEDDLLRFLLTRLGENSDPLERVRIARALGKSRLGGKQLEALAEVVARLGPLEVPHLLPAYAQAEDEAAGLAIFKALEKSPGRSGLTASDLHKTFERYPASVQVEVKKLSAAIDALAGDQKKRLEELLPLMAGGDVERGRNVFFGPRALCAACHAVQGKGGTIGPEMSKIGAIRAGRDLLESVVFPSASFARGFESWIVETKAGAIVTGLLARESSDALVLVTTDRQEIRLQRADIESMQPARVSIMPQGLDTVLTREEIRDLMGFLQSLR